MLTVGQLYSPIWLGSRLSSLPSLLASAASSGPSWRVGPPHCVGHSIWKDERVVNMQGCKRGPHNPYMTDGCRGLKML